MTTLADMTPEQREQCVGMWVECAECKALDVGPSILDTLYENEALLMGPNMHPHDVELESITPRKDLPRAWQPDGTPVAGKWEIDADSDLEVVARTSAPIAYRRWIGKWEEE